MRRSPKSTARIRFGGSLESSDIGPVAGAQLEEIVAADVLQVVDDLLDVLASIAGHDEQRVLLSALRRLPLDTRFGLDERVSFSRKIVPGVVGTPPGDADAVTRIRDTICGDRKVFF